MIKYINIQAQNWVVLIISLCVISCTQDVYFDSPQPNGISYEHVIPSRYRGMYRSVSDGSLIKVDSNAVYAYYKTDYVDEIKEIRQTENCNLTHGKMYLEDIDICAPFAYLDDDFVSISILEVDTIFSFGSCEAAKMYNDMLFMSFYNQFCDGWSTFIIQPIEEFALEYRSFDIPDSIVTSNILTRPVRVYTESDGDEKYIISPSLSELDDFIRLGYTSYLDTLLRLNDDYVID